MEENKKWCVYVHTNLINGKKYVGKTCKKPEYRWNEGKGYKAQKHFWNAIQKYGWDHFSHVILADDLEENEARLKEIEYIEHFQSMNPKYGYNQTAGGEGMLGWHHTEVSRAKIIESNHKRTISEETRIKQRLSHKGKYVGENNPYWGKTHSEETKAKISKANTGNHHEMTDEIKRRISETRMGKYAGQNSPWFGRKHTEEQKRKIGNASKIYQNLPEVKEAKRIRVLGDKNPMFGKKSATAKAVCQFEKDGSLVAEYESAMDAKKVTGISNASIGECCKGKMKSAGGYIWKYKDIAEK